MNNRLHNAKNPWQGEAKKVLCVCSAGLLRSPTAANVLHRAFGFNTRSAGLEHDFALIPVDDVLLHWADAVVCMNEQQRIEILSKTDKPVFNLDIEDSFSFMDNELQEMIIESARGFITEI